MECANGAQEQDRRWRDARAEAEGCALCMPQRERSFIGDSTPCGKRAYSPIPTPPPRLLADAADASAALLPPPLPLLPPMPLLLLLLPPSVSQIRFSKYRLSSRYTTAAVQRAGQGRAVRVWSVASSRLLPSLEENTPLRRGSTWE